MRSLPGVLVAGTLALAAAPTGAEETQYLYSIPALLAPDQALPLGDDIVATIKVPDTDLAVATLDGMRGIDVVATDGSAVTVAMITRATLPGEPLPGHLEASFVIDFDEPVFDEPLKQLENAYGETPTRAELAEFVYEFVSDKTYVRDFDLASRVAGTGEGDCTEHAVMLAALSRATGRPARVVLGVLVISGTERTAGFGHAWTEIYEGDRWHIADATQPERDGPDLHTVYLPIIGLENEGPGYGMDLARMVRLQPSRVSEISDAATN